MDLTLETWVPSFRCSEAHRIHRKIPNYNIIISRMIEGTREGGSKYTPTRPRCVLLSSSAQSDQTNSSTTPQRTWVVGPAIGTPIVPGNSLYEVLQYPFVSRLLAFVKHWHGGDRGRKGVGKG
jgi:hypothetical protein